MSNRQSRLARLEAASSGNWTPWRFIVWDPKTGETLEEAQLRQLGPNWRGNIVMHEVIDPPPRTVSAGWRSRRSAQASIAIH